MKKTYSKPEAKKVVFDYTESVTAAQSGCQWGGNLPTILKDAGIRTFQWQQPEHEWNALGRHQETKRIGLMFVWMHD